MKREINLSPEQVKAILLEAKNHSLRDYLILKTMTIGDFRIGEVVGSATRHWVPSRKKWEPAEPNLKGLQIQDLQDDGIWIEGKGWKKVKNPAPPKKVPLPRTLVDELRGFVGNRECEKCGHKHNLTQCFMGKCRCEQFRAKIFLITESRVQQLTRFYAKRAGVIDWKLVHPHRFRHFTTTQIARKHGVLAARDIARHANISTTNRYIAELPEEEKRKIIQAQEDLISA